MSCRIFPNPTDLRAMTADILHRLPSGPLRILFVCSGNTCRSPMAEIIARRTAKENGVEGYEFRSAGTSTVTGLPASEGARRAAERHGLSLAGHTSSLLTQSAIEWADLVFPMAPKHLLRVASAGGDGKAILLAAFAEGLESEEEQFGVPDPFGGDDETYEATFMTLEALVTAALDRLSKEDRK